MKTYLYRTPVYCYQLTMKKTARLTSTKHQKFSICEFDVIDYKSDIFPFENLNFLLIVFLNISMLFCVLFKQLHNTVVVHVYISTLTIKQKFGVHAFDVTAYLVDTFF